ncbi:MAG: hypothetical protein SFU99_00270 [Saprospiraceae bacterium]|nr:hypothetical protein [Saprospiraceae bacterium]
MPQNLLETSGLYYAGPDSLWWHNDSGDQPRLVLTDQKGNIKKEMILPVTNRDWEDITHDNFGNIYIGDFGNNSNARRDLCIYIFNSINETLDSILFTYPDQRAFPPPAASCNFDMEGFFWHNDSLHLFSKNRLISGNYYTKHYILPAQAGVFIAEARDSIYLKKCVVTAAAISPDGQRVALLSYFFRKILGFIPKTRTTIWSFSDFSNTDFFKGNLQKQKVKKCLVPTQFEALDFIDNQSVYVASERTPLYKQKAKLVKLKPSRKMIFP